MRQPKTTIVSFVLAVAAGSFSACKTHVAPAPLRVGVMANFTNEYSETSGLPTERGAKLAAQVINEAGGVLVGRSRYPISIVFKDFDDRPDAASTAARSLINQDAVDAIVGPQFSRHAIPVAVLAEKARIPMISPMSSNPLTTADKEHVYRLAYLDSVQARAMARFAAEELEARRAAILFDVSSAYGREMSSRFRETFESLGGTLVSEQSYTGDETSRFEELIKEISDQKPEVLWLPNRTRYIAEQIQLARRHGIDAHFLGGDTWDLQVLGALSESQGAYVTHQWHGDLATDLTREFVSLYERTYGEAPRVTAAMTYDAFGLLFQALRDAEAMNPESIQIGLSSMREYSGVTGTLRFNGTGNPERQAVICRIEDGEAVIHKLIAPGETGDSGVISEP